MTILEHLERRSTEGSKEEASFVRSLADLGSTLSTQAEAHLKQVIAQHPGFDLHDSSHSSNVNKNIQSLLGESGIKARSASELFLLHVASYLHDCAMALPQWELNLLQITEGVETKDAASKPGVRNDLKPVLGFEAASRLISAEASTIFGQNKLPLDWLFAARAEQDFVGDLAERLCAYQSFRNGYVTELRDLQSDPVIYAKRSEELRQEFIRRTHCTRIETWIRNLEGLFEQRLSGAWGKALAHDLAVVCRSHGEGGDFIRSLQTEAMYLGNSHCNLQLVALLLRVADIIDFSAARAPSILLREKLITSPISRDHWDVKNEGISYSFDVTPNGAIRVRYSAYFQNPKLYFLFQDYLDWVDTELILYSQITGSKKSGIEPLSTPPPVEPKADRSGIRFDSKRFEPIHGCRFSLDQKRILELLMGVKLYKEPFACIRELYQNALDATRCMLAAEGQKSSGNIEFGIHTDPSTTYIYCRDNGVGMTKEIVSRFLLKVGNSYYRSKDFQRLSASWNDAFTPVSQFGIGILSCFMIGTRMEIVSKPLPNLYDEAEPICFVIDGPHEHFYYKPVEPSDRESVGKHGTIVKLYLSDRYRKKLHASPISNIAFWQHAAGSLHNHAPLKAEVDAWQSHLYHAICGFVGDYPTQIDVTVKFSDGSVASLIRATTPFDFTALRIPRPLVEIWESESHWYHRGEPSYLSVFDHLVHNSVSVEYLGATFTTLVSFPRAGFPNKSYRALDAVRFIGAGNCGLLVDGIRVSNAHSSKDAIDSLTRTGILNFRGRQRPLLSVDRLTVVEWPEELTEIVEELANRTATLLIEQAVQHARNYKLPTDSDEIRLLWDYLFIRFGFLAGTLISGIIKTPEANYQDAELSVIAGRPSTLTGIVTAVNLTLSWTKFQGLQERSQRVLVGKLAAAASIVIEDSRIHIQGTEFAPLEKDDTWNWIREWTYVYRADEWRGKFQDFDLVSMTWPVIPARLFDKIESIRSENRSVNKRTKLLHYYSNSIAAIGDLDPATIHQRLGIYRLKKDSILSKKPASSIYRFDETANNFGLLEFGLHYEPESTERWVLCVYIGPRELSPEEKQDVERHRAEDPDYVRGVIEGWSILFLGQKDVNVICIPGQAPRKQLVERIPSSFWKAHADLTFRFLDGESLSANT